MSKASAKNAAEMADSDTDALLEASALSEVRPRAELRKRGPQKAEAAAAAVTEEDDVDAPSQKKRKGDVPAAAVAVPQFVTDPDNLVGWAVTSVSHFAAESVRLVRKCTKPDAREFRKIAWACAVGFILMGFIGYLVKLIFIPINNIIVGG